MGFFDRFAGKKADQPKPDPDQNQTADPEASGGGVMAALSQAREKLEAKSLDDALVIYSEILATAGDRADVLVTISGDLGANGHLPQVVELIAPLYDATRHGPATGVHLLQAYLALKQTDAAQHVLDILFTLNRPELEDRLHGFSNALAEVMLEERDSLVAETGGGTSTEVPKIALVTISKPIWFYGLESLTAEILPQKSNRARRLAFAQLAVLGVPTEEMGSAPDGDLMRWARALPLWFAEIFCFSPQYQSVAAVGLLDQPSRGKHPVIFPREWREENLQQLVNTSQEPVDYIMTGALRRNGESTELILRLWEVKKYRERKQFSAAWTRETMDGALAGLVKDLGLFMEWSGANSGLPYAPPLSPRRWLESTDALLDLFFIEKSLVAAERITNLPRQAEEFAEQAPSTVAASLAWLQYARRLRSAGVDTPLPTAKLLENEIVLKASAILNTA